MDPNVFVPDLIKPFWPFIAGGAFPEGSYAQISAKAAELEGLAEALGRFQLESGGAVAHLLESGAWDGAAKEEFARLFGKLVASAGGAAGQGGGPGGGDPVAVLAYVKDLVSREAVATRRHATDIDHTQWMMIVGVVAAAAVIVRLRILAVANPGVTPLIWSRLAFTRMENQLIKAELLKNMVVFGGIMGGLDAGVQGGQWLAGHRKKFNGGSLAWSAGTGMLTGLLFGGMTVGASRLVTDDMVGVVAKDGAGSLRGLVAGAPNTVAGRAVMSGAAATAASVPMLAMNGQLDAEHVLYSVVAAVVGGVGPIAVHPDTVTGRSGEGAGEGAGGADGGPGGSGDRSGGGSVDGFGGGPGGGVRPGGVPEGRGLTPPLEGSSPSVPLGLSPDRTSLAALDEGAAGDRGGAPGDGSGGSGGSNGQVGVDRGVGAGPARPAADGVVPAQVAAGGAVPAHPAGRAGVEGAGRAGERVAPEGGDGVSGRGAPGERAVAPAGDGARPARPVEGDAPVARTRVDGPAAEGGPAPRAADGQGGQAVPRAADQQGGPVVPAAGHDGGPAPSHPGSDAAPAVREREAARQAPAPERQATTAADIRATGDGLYTVIEPPARGAQQGGFAGLQAGAVMYHHDPVGPPNPHGWGNGQPARPGAEDGAGGTTPSHPGGGDGRTPAAARVDPEVTAGREIAETIRVPIRSDEQARTMARLNELFEGRLTPDGNVAIDVPSTLLSESLGVHDDGGLVGAALRAVDETSGAAEATRGHREAADVVAALDRMDHREFVDAMQRYVDKDADLWLGRKAARWSGHLELTDGQARFLGRFGKVGLPGLVSKFVDTGYTPMDGAQFHVGSIRALLEVALDLHAKRGEEITAMVAAGDDRALGHLLEEHARATDFVREHGMMVEERLGRDLTDAELQAAGRLGAMVGPELTHGEPPLLPGPMSELIAAEGPAKVVETYLRLQADGGDHVFGSQESPHRVAETLRDYLAAPDKDLWLGRKVAESMERMLWGMREVPDNLARATARLIGLAGPELTNPLFAPDVRTAMGDLIHDVGGAEKAYLLYRQASESTEVVFAKTGDDLAMALRGHPAFESRLLEWGRELARQADIEHPTDRQARDLQHIRSTFRLGPRDNFLHLPERFGLAEGDFAGLLDAYAGAEAAGHAPHKTVNAAQLIEAVTEFRTARELGQRLGLDDLTAAEAQALNRLNRLAPEVANMSDPLGSPVNHLILDYGYQRLAEAYLRATVERFGPVTTAATPDALAAAMDIYLPLDRPYWSGRQIADRVGLPRLSHDQARHVHEVSELFRNDHRADMAEERAEHALGGRRGMFDTAMRALDQEDPRTHWALRDGDHDGLTDALVDFAESTGLHLNEGRQLAAEAGIHGLTDLEARALGRLNMRIGFEERTGVALPTKMHRLVQERGLRETLEAYLDLERKGGAYASLDHVRDPGAWLRDYMDAPDRRLWLGEKIGPRIDGPRYGEADYAAIGRLAELAGPELVGGWLKSDVLTPLGELRAELGHPTALIDKYLDAVRRGHEPVVQAANSAELVTALRADLGLDGHSIVAEAPKVHGAAGDAAPATSTARAEGHPAPDPRRVADPSFNKVPDAFHDIRHTVQDTPRALSPSAREALTHLVDRHPELVEIPRSHHDLKEEAQRLDVDLSFEQVEELRLLSYHAHGLEPPALSRESLDAFLWKVWLEQSEIYYTGDIYSLYNRSSESNPLNRTPQSYMDSIVNIAHDRPPHARSVIQATRKSVLTLEGEPATPEVGGDFFPFIRAHESGSNITERLYVNANADKAPELMEALVREVVDVPDRFPGVYAAKVSGYQAVTRRADNIVIYADDDTAIANVVAWLREYQQKDPAAFMQETPPMTQKVMDGISRGAEPLAAGASFGLVRSKAISDALDMTREVGGDINMFMRNVSKMFLAFGVDFDKPHANLPEETP
ncbi:T3SS effector HopA1 family protein [Streptosporangium sp. NBC_01639]|uniref:T3SS effector HopA1 family protein n=1 Tax=Streptosporangium sp. NBC_01639 TaxID=2975948 RepID=UPI00386C85A6|nr:T3SS effector HopA1 family protein [Streptosporangium sp. NBC_01639]